MKKPKLTDEEKLHLLLARWEVQPGVMLFGAGAHTCGTVASWIRKAMAAAQTNGHQGSEG